jgi:dTDP-glucose 4,6-dehydratase
MSFEPHNIFITGGAGFIGSNFVHYWLKKTNSGRVVVYDALTYAGNIDSLVDVKDHPRFVFVRGDICDEAAVRALLQQYEIDTVAHFAAESHVDRSILGPDDFIRTNVVGTHALLKSAKSWWLDPERSPRPHRFHHVSTDEVYGSLTPDAPAFSEDNAYAPNSPYSASKAGSDHLVRAYHETYGLNTTVTNCSNNYGPYHFPEKLIPLTIVHILLGKPLPVYGDGLQVRDWLHVEDHCVAIHLSLTEGKPGEVYNVGGNSETTNIHIVRTLCELVDEYLTRHPEHRAVFPDSPSCNAAQSNSLITHVRDRPGHDRRYAINFAKAGRELGYRPLRDLKSGLASTVEWYLGNVDWWRKLLGKGHAEWVRKNYGG